MATVPSLSSSSTRWRRQRGTLDSKEKESDKEMLFIEDRERAALPLSSSPTAFFTGTGRGRKDIEGEQESSSFSADAAASLDFSPTSFDLFLSATEETSAQFAVSCLGLSVKEVMAILQGGEGAEEVGMSGGSSQKMAMTSSRAGNHHDILAILEASRDTTSWDPLPDEKECKAEEKNREGIEVVQLVNHSEIRTGFMHTLFDDDANNISIWTSSDLEGRKKKKKERGHQKQGEPPFPASSTTHSSTNENNKGGSSLLPISSQKKEEEEVSRSSFSSSSSSSTPPPVLFDTFLWGEEGEEEERKTNKVSGEDGCSLPHRRITSLQEREAPLQPLLKEEGRREVEPVFVVPDIDDFLSLTPPPPPPPSFHPHDDSLSVLSPASVASAQENTPTREEAIKSEAQRKNKEKSRHIDHAGNKTFSLHSSQTSRTERSESLSSSSSSSSNDRPSFLPSLPGLAHFYDPNLAPPRDQMWDASLYAEKRENQVKDENKHIEIVHDDETTEASTTHTTKEEGTEAADPLSEGNEQKTPSTGGGDVQRGRTSSSAHCISEIVEGNAILTTTRIARTTAAVPTTLCAAPACSPQFHPPSHSSISRMNYRLGPLGVFGSITNDVLSSLKGVIEEITDEVLPFSAEPDGTVDSNGNKKRERWDTGIEAFNKDWKAYRLAPVVIDSE